jgi:hypothetical protein
VIHAGKFWLPGICRASTGQGSVVSPSSHYVHGWYSLTVSKDLPFLRATLFVVRRAARQRAALFFYSQSCDTKVRWSPGRAERIQKLSNPLEIRGLLKLESMLIRRESLYSGRAKGRQV